MPGPDIWGPHGWKFIHYITLGYPNNPTEQDKKKYYNFFMALSNVIPCGICASHFKQHLEITPLDEEALKDKESLMIWGIMMHNHVNAKNNKKILSINDGINAIIKNDDTCIVFDDEQISLDNITNLNNFKNNKVKETLNQNVEKGNNKILSLILSILIILNFLLILFLLYKLNSFK